jgi:hypothetical protein
MRKRYIQVGLELYEAGTEPQQSAPTIIDDIKPYRSMITGEMITSRSQHREHLRQHGCVEVGNDSSLLKPREGIPECSPQSRRELIRAQVDAMTHRDFREAIKRDVDRVKWNSNY